MEIERGVRPGDWVVVGGMQRIKHDMVVKAEKFAEGAVRPVMQAKIQNRPPPHRRASTRQHDLPSDPKLPSSAR